MFPLEFCSFGSVFFASVFSSSSLAYYSGIFDCLIRVSTCIGRCLCIPFHEEEEKNNYFRLRFRLSIRGTIKSDGRKKISDFQMHALHTACTPFAECFGVFRAVCICSYALAQQGWRSIGSGYHIVHIKHLHWSRDSFVVIPTDTQIKERTFIIIVHHIPINGAGGYCVRSDSVGNEWPLPLWFWTLCDVLDSESDVSDSECDHQTQRHR